jgi:ABC-type uncharacterized transport system permease subunit
VIRLEKRPQPSSLFAMATPVLAVLATMLFGGLLFAALGKDPVQSIITIFWEPLFGEFAFGEGCTLGFDRNRIGAWV